MVTETLAAILSGARSRLGWSLRDAERATGVPNAHLSQLETGKIGHPGIGVLVKLAKAYGITAAFRVISLHEQRTSGEFSRADMQPQLAETPLGVWVPARAETAWKIRAVLEVVK